MCLNGVRPRRPEQYQVTGLLIIEENVSMESGLEDRNNPPPHPRSRPHA